MKGLVKRKGYGDREQGRCIERVDDGRVGERGKEGELRHELFSKMRDIYFCMSINIQLSLCAHAKPYKRPKV